MPHGEGVSLRFSSMQVARWAFLLPLQVWLESQLCSPLHPLFPWAPLSSFYIFI